MKTVLYFFSQRVLHYNKMVGTEGDIEQSIRLLSGREDTIGHGCLDILLDALVGCLSLWEAEDEDSQEQQAPFIGELSMHMFRYRLVCAIEFYKLMVLSESVIY